MRCLLCTLRSLLPALFCLLILLYFLLVYDQTFIAKLVKLLPTLSDKKTAVGIAHDIESQVSRYLFTVTAINTCLGLAVGTAVGLLGLRESGNVGRDGRAAQLRSLLGCSHRLVCMTIGADFELRQSGLRPDISCHLSRFSAS